MAFSKKMHITEKKLRNENKLTYNDFMNQNKVLQLMFNTEKPGITMSSIQVDII
jgi:uncharacterized protein YjaZ